MANTNYAEVLRIQLENLRDERGRIDKIIRDIESALRTAEGLGGYQREFQLGAPEEPVNITLLDAVKRVCMSMVDGISRQRVQSAITSRFPWLKPAPSSVSAALINLSKGSAPFLTLALEGRGRTPAFYSTQSDQPITLTPEQQSVLMDKHATQGTGGWQSLWFALQKNFSKDSGVLTMTPALRARVYNYYHSYGVGGWQVKIKRLLGSEFPHLF